MGRLQNTAAGSLSCRRQQQIEGSELQTEGQGQLAAAHAATECGCLALQTNACGPQPSQLLWQFPGLPCPPHRCSPEGLSLPHANSWPPTMVQKEDVWPAPTTASGGTVMRPASASISRGFISSCNQSAKVDVKGKSQVGKYRWYRCAPQATG